MIRMINHQSPLTHTPMFWDVLIALLLIVGAGSSITSWTWIASHPQSSIIIRLALGLFGLSGFLGVLLLLWGSFVEPKTIKVNTKSIHVKGLTDITIAVIGDIHVGPYKGARYVQKIVHRVNALNPDLIVLPGDFIYDHHADLSALAPLKHLRAKLGVFAVLGNHDTGHMLYRKNKTYISYRTLDMTQDIVRMLGAANITMLRNEHVLLEKNGRTFALAGTDHYWMDSCNLPAAFKNIPDDLPVILLSHIPDIILDDTSKRAALIISGHTHGGQIRLPFIGSVYPIPDQLGRAFDQGLFDLGQNRILAITHGIGETMARARLFCPPEILAIRIHA